MQGGIDNCRVVNPTSLLKQNCHVEEAKKNIKYGNTLPSSCGLFCILFSVLGCEGKSFCDILNLFTNNLRFNEEIISHYITNLGCLSI